MVRFILKEASLLIAFIVLGGLLLLCFWVTHNVHENVLKEYKNSQISVVLKTGADEGFRELVEKNHNVIRYDYFSSAKNKERLGETYPELKNIIAPLEERFFPSSALVTVHDASKFLQLLDKSPELFQTQVLHQPPTKLSRFLNVMVVIFSMLWLLTLTLVLYFNLERITVREEPRWSLMKMLGAKPFMLFWPLWHGQALRITIASVCAMILAAAVSHQLRAFLVWDWTTLPLSVWIGFFFISLLVTSAISFTLFSVRYRRISIG